MHGAKATPRPCPKPQCPVSGALVTTAIRMRIGLGEPLSSRVGAPGVDSHTMPNYQSGDMSIGYEIPERAGHSKLVAEHAPMAIAWANGIDKGLGQPSLDGFHRKLWSQRIGEDIRVGCDSQEGEIADPRQADVDRAPQHRIHPCARWPVVDGVPVHRIDEQIRVDEDHFLSLSLRASSSSSSRSANPSALSRLRRLQTLPIASGPRR